MNHQVQELMELAERAKASPAEHKKALEQAIDIISGGYGLAARDAQEATTGFQPVLVCLSPTEPELACLECLACRLAAEISNVVIAENRVADRNKTIAELRECVAKLEQRPAELQAEINRLRMLARQMIVGNGQSNEEVKEGLLP